MTSSVSTYEFTAFTEADLLDSDTGSSISKGDRFTLPATPTTCFTVKDDDTKLSGDAKYGERADDRSYQDAHIEVDGETVFSNVEIYAEKVWELEGSDGKTYYLVEIEVRNGNAPGEGDDFFTFKGDVPPAGVELKVVDSENVKGHGISYDKLDAGDKEPEDPQDPDCIIIEAEDFHEKGFHIRDGDQASGGEIQKLNNAGGHGDLWTTFNGPSGTYDLNIHVQDEDDGQSEITVKVNGVVVGLIRLDRDTDGGGSDDGPFSTFTLEDIEINDGDQITLWVKGDGCEFVRFDKVVLKPSTPPPPPPEGQVCIDFTTDVDGNPLSAGVKLDGTVQLEGVTFEAIRSEDNDGVFNDAMIFDAANPTGGDTDLSQPAQGNVLIISEDGDSSDPDDEAHGGMIVARLDQPSTVNSLVVLDTEERGGRIELFDDAGNLLAEFAIPPIPNGSLQTIDLGDTENVKTMKVTLKGSGAIDNFKFVPPPAPVLGALGDFVFFDTDFDGIQDVGETGVAGVTVILEGAGADGVFGTADDISASTVTAADGSYLFDNLEAGDYRVSFENIPTNTVFTAANQGADDALDSDAVPDSGNPARATTQTVTLAPGEVNLTLDAGLVELAGLGDFVFLDANSNGIQDAGEVGIADVTVNLLDTGLNVIGTTTTDANGFYSFTELFPGDYIVEFVAPTTPPGSTDGLTFSPKDQGADDALDSDADQTTGRTDVINLEAGEFDPTIDAGLKACFDVPDDGLIGVNGLFEGNLPPVIQFNFDGQTQYDSTTDAFTVSATPTLGLIGDPPAPTPFPTTGRLLIDIQVDENGDLVAGDAFDFQLFNDLDGDQVVDAGEEVYLQGEVLAFGSDGSGVGTDSYDVIVEVNGGSLAADFDKLIGVAWDSEQSTFNDRFDEDFGGNAKGNIGNIGIDCIC